MLTAIKNSAGEMCLQLENPYPNLILANSTSLKILNPEWADFNLNNPPVPISGFTLSEGEKVEEGEVRIVYRQTNGLLTEQMGGYTGEGPVYIRIPAKEGVKLTDKVQYSNEADMSDEQKKLVNYLADKEPSCYADIAYLMIEHTKAITEQRDELLAACMALREFIDDVVPSCAGGDDQLYYVKNLADKAIQKAHGK